MFVAIVPGVHKNGQPIFVMGIKAVRNEIDTRA